VKTQQPKQPIGIIQSLSSGFDLVTRHPELMLLPILLDVFLWLGPRLSAYPLFRAFIDLMQSPSGAETLGPSFQELLDQVGQVFNLFWWLSPTLLGVPSLMVGAPALKVPNGPPTIWPVSSTLTYLALFLVLNVAGLGLAAAYWGLLSSRVRKAPFSPGRIVVLWWGLIKIAVLLTVVTLMIGFPTLLVVTLVGLFSPLVAQLVLVMGGAVLLWALFYLAFTLHGVALRDAWVFQAVRASVALMRTQFVPTLGLVMIVLAIYLGMGFVWNIPPSDSWLRVAGILGHAFTATGLITATALYYLDRTQELQGASRK
jgi:hypothetical protein